MLTKAVLFAAVAVMAVAGQYASDYVDGRVIEADMDGRIIGGAEAGKYEARYIVLVYEKATLANGTIKQIFRGTGAFLSGKTIITAASIIEKGKAYMIYWGAHNNFMCGHAGIPVVAVIRPPNCDVERRVNNIALLIMETRVTDCKACRDVQFLEVQTLPLEDNSVLQTAGFGFMNQPCYRGDKNSTVLRKTDMTVLSDHKCKKLTDNASQKGRLICTRPTNYISTVCSGDEGAPLVDITYARLVGVLNFGDEYCENGAPVVYTAIAPYAKWLNKHIVY